MNLDARVRENAKRLIGELGKTQAEVVRNAVAADHKLTRSQLNHILKGREMAQGKADAIAAGLGVDVSLLTQPVVEGSA